MGHITMLKAHDPRQNTILASLPPSDYDRLARQLKWIRLPLGWDVFGPENGHEYVYFVTSGIVSLLHVLGDQSSAEIAIVGHDGLVGINLYIGGEPTPSRGVVQSVGAAYRISGSALKAEFENVGMLHFLMMRYTQVLLTQMAQTAVCQRHHSVDQQLCRWLLLSLDCIPSNKLVMTNNLIAKMLSTDEDGVLAVAARLEGSGLIRYSRGRITVRDRVGLELRACSCYEIVKSETRRLSGPLQ
jgi:CRP-like cAMP-binding protein